MINSQQQKVHTPGEYIRKPCTWPWKCARRAQGTPLISDTAYCIMIYLIGLNWYPIYSFRLWYIPQLRDFYLFFFFFLRASFNGLQYYYLAILMGLDLENRPFWALAKTNREIKKILTLDLGSFLKSTGRHEDSLNFTGWHYHFL